MSLLWSVAVLAQLALLIAYWRRGLLKVFPWFSSFLVVQVAGNLALMWIGRTPNNPTYVWTWSGIVAVLLALRILIVTPELALHILGPEASPTVRRAFWGGFPVAVIIFGASLFGDKQVLDVIHAALQGVNGTLLLILGGVIYRALELKRWPPEHLGHVRIALLLIGLELLKRGGVNWRWFSGETGVIVGLAGSAVICGIGTVAIWRSKRPTT